MNHYEIIKKLIGPIIPVGETNEDWERLANLDATTDLVDKLVLDIRAAAAAQHNHQASMAKIGKRAQAFLDELKET